MATATWNGATGSYTDPTQWSDGAVPGSGDVAVINSGTVNASSVAFSNVTVGLNANTSTAGTLNLTSDSFDAASVLLIDDGDSYGGTPAPSLSFTGNTTNSGTIDFEGTTTSVQFAAGASLTNAGVINLIGSSPQIQYGIGTGIPTITNNGTIAVTNAANLYQSPVVNATITGTGTISLATNAKLDLRGAVGAGQTVAFTGGVNAGSALQIDSPSAFAATVSGFVSGDRLILTNIPFTGFSYTQTSSSGGTLLVYNGSTVEGGVNLAGTYSQSSLSITANALGTSGNDNVIITTTVNNPATGASAVIPVYRFFDTVYGTHLITQDPNEVATILATRPDLHEETNNFGAVPQGSASSEPVYRFFESTGEAAGTHFYTASFTEYVGLTTPGTSTYRPDLIPELSSTIYENSVQLAGDVAVYRFFDESNGSQLLTGDSTEIHNITTPGLSTYRGNLVNEGIDFYAPAGSFYTTT